MEEQAPLMYLLGGPPFNFYLFFSFKVDRRQLAKIQGDLYTTTTTTVYSLLNSIEVPLI